MRRRIWPALLALGLVAGAGARAQGKKPSRLLESLERELGLTRSLVDVEKGLSALEQTGDSLAYASSVLEHGGKESMRRLRSYRVARSTRERQTRRRGRALYKLARGGVLRIVFEDSEDRATADRIARGRTVRWLVQHDLAELRVHQRAEERARGELLTAARELQALGGLNMMQEMQRRALSLAGDQLDPQVREAHRQRRRASRKSHAGRPEKQLMALVASQRSSLRGHGLDLLEPRSLVRPVPGRLAGSFGTYEDRVLRVPMVRNGVELAAGPRAQVKAAAAGTVAFVGHLPGFDQVVVIDHEGGYLSLTGRLLAVEVDRDMKVEAGRVLGSVAPKTIDDGLGRTVYFELRHGERPIDPAPYLR